MGKSKAVAIPKMHRDIAEIEAKSRRADGEAVEWFDMINEIIEESLPKRLDKPQKAR